MANGPAPPSRNTAATGIDVPSSGLLTSRLGVVLADYVPRFFAYYGVSNVMVYCDGEELCKSVSEVISALVKPSQIEPRSWPNGTPTLIYGRDRVSGTNRQTKIVVVNRLTRHPIHDFRIKDLQDAFKGDCLERIFIRCKDGRPDNCEIVAFPGNSLYHSWTPPIGTRQTTQRLRTLVAVSIDVE